MSQPKISSFFTTVKRGETREKKDESSKLKPAEAKKRKLQAGLECV